jgi:hypothetical protein
MIDGLHIPWNSTKKPFATVLSGVGRRLKGKIMGAM